MIIFNRGIAIIASLPAAICFYFLIKNDGGSGLNPFLLGIVVFLGVYILIWGYSLPLLIAEHRQHPQVLPIAILNIAAGWSGVF